MAVVKIRAQALHDLLRVCVHVMKLDIAPYHLTQLQEDTSWAAQRLSSACERALGVRHRHYDSA